MSNKKQKSENMNQGHLKSALAQDTVTLHWPLSWCHLLCWKILKPLSSDQLRMIADSFPDLPSTHGLQSEYERWWVRWHEDKDVGGTISNFIDSLHLGRQ